MTTKTEAAAMVADGRAIETFHHATLGHFNVTLLRETIHIANARRPGHFRLQHCAFAEMRMVDGIAADPFEYLLANREIDHDRAMSLGPDQITEPLIFLLCPEGTNGEAETHLLVDGIHRLYRRKTDGWSGFSFYMIPLFSAPMVDESRAIHLPWGEKEVVPGFGLVRRQA